LVATRGRDLAIRQTLLLGQPETLRDVRIGRLVVADVAAACVTRLPLDEALVDLRDHERKRAEELLRHVVEEEAGLRIGEVIVFDFGRIRLQDVDERNGVVTASEVIVALAGIVAVVVTSNSVCRRLSLCHFSGLGHGSSPERKGAITAAPGAVG